MIDRKLLYKSISYRIIITIVTALIAGWHVAFGLAILATIIYYVHEKIWEKINV